ncbi:MerR family transcriptional regulator [Streptomyces alkaliterrae]|uniref:MerR family transcriptional regulator n=1 Tax=Streptomyces alkaliterrae TaxID=2213162 RepID=A0A5P0YX54_9ACTN|nr:MerR family transcriptional regulator [Streptomyces alkaliterrae]MBB1262125.1 MerR family transcriptional regulator [Streptomyces alkaliterrae]MQS04864.1 MerR family transcriptional regulator [Streptomyces alkaliterrae]
MRIGQLAAETGASVRALRHYEAAGLLGSERAANGYRVYNGGAVVRVRNIRRLLAAGLTLEDVREFLPCLDGDVAAAPPAPAGLEVARRRLAVLDARIAEQLAARERLVAALRAAGEQPPPPPGPSDPLVAERYARGKCPVDVRGEA